jgi:hypothetical protein
LFGAVRTLLGQIYLSNFRLNKFPLNCIILAYPFLGLTLADPHVTSLLKRQMPSPYTFSPGLPSPGLGCLPASLRSLLNTSLGRRLTASALESALTTRVLSITRLGRIVLAPVRAGESGRPTASRSPAS